MFQSAPAVPDKLDHLLHGLPQFGLQSRGPARPARLDVRAAAGAELLYAGQHGRKPGGLCTLLRMSQPHQYPGQRQLCVAQEAHRRKDHAVLGVSRSSRGQRQAERPVRRDPPDQLRPPGRAAVQRHRGRSIFRGSRLPARVLHAQVSRSGPQPQEVRRLIGRMKPAVRCPKRTGRRNCFNAPAVSSVASCSWPEKKPDPSATRIYAARWPSPRRRNEMP